MHYVTCPCIIRTLALPCCTIQLACWPFLGRQARLEREHVGWWLVVDSDSGYIMYFAPASLGH